MSSPSIGIVFEACACRGPFHIGVLDRLRETGLSFHMAGGSSCGSLMATAVALNKESVLFDLWNELIGIRIFDARRILSGSWPVLMAEILHRVIEPHLGDRTMASAQKPLAIAVSQLQGSSLSPSLFPRFVPRVLTHLDAHIRMIDALKASCFYPLMYANAPKIEGRSSLDGAITMRTPLLPVASFGATHLLACITHPKGILEERWMSRKLMHIGSHNVRVIHPKHRLIAKDFDFDRMRFEETYQAGRQAAETFLRHHSSWLPT